MHTKYGVQYQISMKTYNKQRWYTLVVTVKDKKNTYAEGRHGRSRGKQLR